MEKFKIVILEDQQDINDLIAIHLKQNNFDYVQFFSGKDFLKYLSNNNTFHLLILDLMLPEVDGIEILKRMKDDQSYKNIPVIILTAKSDESDKIVGLELGSDDYITKPFSVKELIARIKVILKRYYNEKDESIIKIGKDIIIDTNRAVCSYKNRTVNLTSTEFKILTTLAKRKGWIFSREKILLSIWGNDKIVTKRTVDVHIKSLRDKIDPEGKHIKNIRGMGYKIED
uniref:Response regulator transcription factor n=1 Tax=candidate division WOR-3 bacterium TaxID=2052148 RepID=A0A7C3N5G0_UNCW3